MLLAAVLEIGGKGYAEFEFGPSEAHDEDLMAAVRAGHVTLVDENGAPALPEPEPGPTCVQNTDLGRVVEMGFLRVLAEVPGQGCVVAATDQLVTYLSHFPLFRDPTPGAPTKKLVA